VPEPAEIDPLMLKLDDWGDLRETLDAPDERVFDDLAKMTGETQKPLRRDGLVAKKRTR
jgi:hypothetical protein